MLRESLAKRWLLVPLVSLLTLLVFPVVLYWRKRLQMRWLYSQAVSVEAATHIYLVARDGSSEIVEL